MRGTSAQTNQKEHSDIKEVSQHWRGIPANIQCSVLKTKALLMVGFSFMRTKKNTLAFSFVLMLLWTLVIQAQNSLIEYISLTLNENSLY